MWLLICSKCGHRVEQEGVITDPCPDCGGNSWLCHLLSQEDQGQSRIGFVIAMDDATLDLVARVVKW